MHANRRCFAIYDRAEDDIARAPKFNYPLSRPEVADLLNNASYDLGYDVE